MSYVNVNGADMGLRFDFSMSLNGNKDIEKALANIFGALDGKQIQKSIRSARSRSLKAGKELGAKLAREEYTARKAAIKKRFIATILNGGSDAGLRFSGFPGLNLIHFMARPNTDTAPRPKRGASVKVKRSGGRYVPTGKQDNSSKPFVAKIKKAARSWVFLCAMARARRDICFMAQARFRPCNRRIDRKRYGKG